MTKEPQPRDPSDHPSLSYRESLRGIILDLATQPVESSNRTIVRGEHRLAGAKFIIAEITSLSDHLPSDIRQLLPERILKLSVYNSAGKGSFDSVTISDDSDQTVIGELDGREIDSLTPQEEEEFIKQFYTMHRLDKLH